MTETLEMLGAPSGRYEIKAYEFMLSNPTITSWDAITGWHDTRLPATIKRMRNKGYPIGDRWINTTDANGYPTRFKEYWLEGKH